MKKKRRLILFVVLLAAAVCWFWRYRSLNTYYQSLSTQQTVCYPMGEKVPFGEDYLEKDMNAAGYYIQVNRFEILSYEEYTATLDAPLSRRGDPPERIAMVYITLYNEDSTQDGVMLTELTLHGVDSLSSLDWDALLASNPVLEGSFGISLVPGASYDLVLPYSLFESSYSIYTWNHLEDYEFFLRITAFPTAKDLAVQ